MRAHRRVNAHAAFPIAFTHHLVVQGFTHAVQALEFKVFVATQSADGRHGIGIV